MSGALSSQDRVERFVADILGSPRALARWLDQSSGVDPAIAGMRGRRIVFTGLGSSRYAALIVASTLRADGVAAWVDDASSAHGTAPAGDLAMVAISASGQTPEVIAAATRHRGHSLVVAVTNDASSPLAAAADVVIPLLAGTEAGGIACRTFRATIAALAVLTGATSPEVMRPVVAGLMGRISDRDRWLPPLVEALDGASAIHVLADASLVGLAEQAALMLREAPRLSAHAYSSGDWLHTGVYLALPGHRALLYPGSLVDDEVVATIERRAGEVVTAEPWRGSPVERAIVDSVIAELLAAELWRRAAALDIVSD